jgi:hypothetical protein
MDRTRLAAICAAFACIVMAPVLAAVASGELAYHPENAAAEVLAVSDKPMPAAVEAAEDAEADMEAQVEEAYYYAPTYYGGSVWYESDDEDAEAAAKEWIAFRESGGSYDARNGRYIGRYQLDSSYLDGDWSKEHQEEVAEDYVADRYGSWQAAQEHHREYGWY